MIDDLDELLTGNDLDWGAVIAAGVLMAVGMAISLLIG